MYFFLKRDGKELHLRKKDQDLIPGFIGQFNYQV